MSRCIEFPPLGYVWNGVGGEALKELIKLNRERAEAEKERKKDKRRRKKEKKKKKRREDGELMQEMQSQKSRHKHDKNKRSREKSDNQKKRKYEVPGLENNSLSEELGQPMISDSVYDSSDNSQNVKRRNDTRSPKDYHNHGSIIDFHFQLQKHKDQAAQSSKPVCSTPVMSTTIAQEMASGPTIETWHPSSRTQVVADEKAETAPAFTFSRSGSMQIESQYRKLIVNWIPHPLQIENPKFDDQEWLFQRRQHRSDMIRRTNAYNDDFSHCHGSNVLYPYAQYLSKADIFALPFVTSF